MKNNSHVFYNGKRYLILYMFTSGYSEIKEVESLRNIKLVHLTEIIKLD